MNNYSKLSLYIYLLSAFIIGMSRGLDAATTVTTSLVPTVALSRGASSSMASSSATAVGAGARKTRAQTHMEAEHRHAHKSARIALLRRTAMRVDQLERQIESLAASEELKVKFLEFWYMIITHADRESLDKSYSDLCGAVSDYIEKCGVSREHFYTDFNLLLPHSLDLLTSVDKECLRFAFFKFAYNHHQAIEKMYIDNNDYSCLSAPCYLSNALAGLKVTGTITSETLELFILMSENHDQELQKILFISNIICGKSNWPSLLPTKVI